MAFALFIRNRPWTYWECRGEAAFRLTIFGPGRQSSTPESSAFEGTCGPPSLLPALFVPNALTLDWQRAAVNSEHSDTCSTQRRQLKTFPSRPTTRVDTLSTFRIRIAPQPLIQCRILRRNVLHQAVRLVDPPAEPMALAKCCLWLWLGAYVCLSSQQLASRLEAPAMFLWMSLPVGMFSCRSSLKLHRNMDIRV